MMPFAASAACKAKEPAAAPNVAATPPTASEEPAPDPLAGSRASADARAIDEPPGTTSPQAASLGTFTPLKGFTRPVTMVLPPGFTSRVTMLDDGIETVTVKGDGIRLELVELEAKSPLRVADLKETLNWDGKAVFVLERDDPDAWVLVRRHKKRLAIDVHVKAIQITCSAQGLDDAQLERAMALCLTLK